MMFDLNQFFSQVCVIDTECTSAIPQEAEIVELAVANWQASDWSINSRLFKPTKPIPPEASATNNISNSMLDGKPTLVENLETVVEMLGTPKFFVAHNAEYDKTVLKHNFISVGVDELADFYCEQTPWICSLRLARHVYANQNFSSWAQNYLRFKLDLEDLDGIGAHRAGDDVRVLIKLFEKILEDAIDYQFFDPNQDLGSQLVELCQQPIYSQVWPMGGKYKNQSLKDIPTDYWLWAFENIGAIQENSPNFDSDLAASVARELESRL